MKSSLQDKKRIVHRRLQLEIIDTDAELERIVILYPKIKQTIDRARDLLGRYSHSINGLIDVREFCGGQEKQARMEVAA